MTREEAIAILNTPKGNYIPREEIEERTVQALTGDDDQLQYDGIDISGFVSDELSTVFEYLRPLRQYRILDVGCGYGRVTRLLAAWDCAEYVGIDPSEKRIEFASKRVGGQGISFHVATPAEYLRSFPDQIKSFDIAYCRTVLQHLPYGEKLDVLRDMRALVKPGGIIILSDGCIFGGLTLEECAGIYLEPKQAVHMIPMPESEVLQALEPCMCAKYMQLMVVIIE
jgi:2-polyprenyl-3-methyl-5-hydroxy-6-metoxy-1,4-benzoquinol methylase